MKPTSFSRCALPWIVGVAVTLLTIFAGVAIWQVRVLQQYDEQLDQLNSVYGTSVDRAPSQQEYIISYLPGGGHAKYLSHAVGAPPDPSLDDLSKLQPPSQLMPLLRPPIAIMNLPVEMIDEQTTVLPQVKHLITSGPIRDANDLEAILRVFPEVEIVLVDNVPQTDAVRQLLERYPRKVHLNAPTADAPAQTDESRVISEGSMSMEVKTNHHGQVEVNWLPREWPPKESTELEPTTEETPTNPSETESTSTAADPADRSPARP
ncbi:hypothetical protein [Blastopirellula retiformator]|uniref:Uncharacterized protein n=1 Tax=Blastopirellula retiformator TaxID=2527970 RepID=A0A5C5V4G2_9BACT|nr:hypothetical protein [Blastopirellula retiformator]TWT32632.1 hypothetical protein Enr8_24370 [Blastopirellula retiformator]